MHTLTHTLNELTEEETIWITQMVEDDLSRMDQDEIKSKFALPCLFDDYSEEDE